MIFSGFISKAARKCNSVPLRTIASAPRQARGTPAHITDRYALLDARKDNLPPNSLTWRAFYDSSIGNDGAGAIITDPLFFTIPVDDHGFHRGHCVFDTCTVSGSKCFGLDFHLDRFLQSASRARIDHSYSKDWLRDTILRTIAASQQRENTFVRYWLTSGRGDFGIVPSPETTSDPRFYAVVHDYGMEKTREREEGVAEVFVKDVPLKPKLLAEVKSNNYMLNALLTLRAKELGGSLGIAVSEDGRLHESSIANVGIVTDDGVFKTPHFDGILAGTSLKRMHSLIADVLAAGHLNGFEFCDIYADEALRASEVIFFGGGFCTPVVELDGKRIGNGCPGDVFKSFDRIMRADMVMDFETDNIPYEMFEKSKITPH